LPEMFAIAVPILGSGVGRGSFSPFALAMRLHAQFATRRQAIDVVRTDSAASQSMSTPHQRGGTMPHVLKPHQLRGCLRSQCLHHRVSSRGTAQLTQRFEHGIVSFFSSKPFNALTASDAQTTKIRCRPPQKFVGQGGFPNARLAGDKHDLPVILPAPLHAISQLGQSPIPSNQFSRGQFKCELGFGRRVTDRGNEPVTLPRQSFDEAGVLGAIAQCAANVEDVCLSLCVVTRTRV